MSPTYTQGSNSSSKTNSLSPDELSPDQLTQLYFSQLSTEEVMGLYRVYEEDFLMFGYNFNFGGEEFPPTTTTKPALKVEEEDDEGST